MNYFKDKQVYITGGSSGMGLEMARQLFSSGAHVLIIARDRTRLEEASQDIERFRISPEQRIGIASVDITDAAAVEQAMARALRENGPPDILINSAGIINCDYFENISGDAFDAVMKTNLYGTRNMIAALLPALKERRGHIAIMASVAGLISMYGYTGYGTSKFALVGFAECIRGELKRQGVGLTVACPPEVDTPMVLEESKTIPPEVRVLKNTAGRLKPGYVAREILRAVARKRFMVVPGLRAKILWYTQRLSPGIYRFSSDMIIRLASRNAARNTRA